MATSHMQVGATFLLSTYLPGVEAKLPQSRAFKSRKSLYMYRNLLATFLSMVGQCAVHQMTISALHAGPPVRNCWNRISDNLCYANIA
eukprot:874492-Amphidinium_carterae.1